MLPFEKYRKIPKISPASYIFERPFLRGLFLEGLKFGKGNLRFKMGYEYTGRVECMSQNPLGWIVGRKFMSVICCTRLKDLDLSKTQPCKYFVYMY